MSKVLGIALVLGVAGAAAATAAATDAGQDVRISRDGKQRVEVIADEQPGMRRLAVLAGRGVQLGVSVRDLDPEQQKRTSGAAVDDVRSGSAAEKAGIRKGDVITEYDGERVRGARHLSRLVTETPEGRSVPVAVLRDGQRVEVTVTPETADLAMRKELEELLPEGQFERLPGFEGRRGFEFHAFPDAEAFKRFGDEFDVFVRPGQRRLGVQIQELTPQLAEYFGAQQGVLISAVDEDSPAAKAGLKAGDVVTNVNGNVVTNSRELVKAVREAEGDVSIDYVRDKKPGSAKAALEPRDKPRVRQSARPI